MCGDSAYSGWNEDIRLFRYVCNNKKQTETKTRQVIDRYDRNCGKEDTTVEMYSLSCEKEGIIESYTIQYEE